MSSTLNEQDEETSEMDEAEGVEGWTLVAHDEPAEGAHPASWA
jgi:hypothetical protein